MPAFRQALQNRDATRGFEKVGGRLLEFECDRDVALGVFGCPVEMTVVLGA